MIVKFLYKDTENCFLFRDTIINHIFQVEQLKKLQLLPSYIKVIEIKEMKRFLNNIYENNNVLKYHVSTTTCFLLLLFSDTCHGSITFFCYGRNSYIFIITRNICTHKPFLASGTLCTILRSTFLFYCSAKLILLKQSSPELLYL